MKFYLKPILSVVVIVVLLGYSSCGPGGGDPVKPEDEQLAKLSSTWKVGTSGNVTLDGVSKKTDYSGFQLVISGTPGGASFGYTTSGRPALSAWPSSGSWNFGTNVTTDIVRDRGNTSKELPITYTVTDNTLELTFTYNGAGEARTEKVTGTGYLHYQVSLNHLNKERLFERAAFFYCLLVSTIVHRSLQHHHGNPISPLSMCSSAQCEETLWFASTAPAPLCVILPHLFHAGSSLHLVQGGSRRREN